MTLRFAKILSPVVAGAVFAVGSVVKAQEGILEVKVGSLQTESTGKVLKEQRLVLQKSKSDLSAVVKGFREDFKNIKREQVITLKLPQKYKPPVFTGRKTVPDKKQFLRRPESSPDAGKIYFEQEIIELPKPRDKEILLNLNERRRRADIEIARREKFIQAQNTEWGRLKAEMRSNPLKSYQEKQTQFSDKIKNLLEQLTKEKGVQRTVFLNLGNTYLASHRHLESLSAVDRWKLSRFAFHSGTIVGSHESALWVFKMALARKPDDGETNFLISKILSEMGERDLALRRARNAEQLFAINNQQDRANQTRSFIELLKNSSP